VPTTATDLRYGRRGGGWLPRGAGVPAPTVPCDVCGAPVLVGTRHRGECQVIGEQLDAEAGGQLVLGL